MDAAFAGEVRGASTGIRQVPNASEARWAWKMPDEKRRQEKLCGEQEIGEWYRGGKEVEEGQTRERRSGA